MNRREILAMGGALGAGLAIARPAWAQTRFKIVTTFTIIADMARNVTGDLAEVVSITKPGADIHNYQPSPGDLIGAQDADLILWNGLNLEIWFERFFQNLAHVASVTVSEGIEPIGIGSGPYSDKPNPHAWMSPTDAKVYVDNIVAGVSAHAPEHAETFARNGEAYKGRIDALVAPIRQALDAIPEERRWLVTSEGAFSYLARDFGLKEAYLWPINADQQGTPQQVRRLIDLIRANPVPAIFSESTVSPKPAEQVARETGIAYGGVLYVDSLTDADGPVPTYLDLIRVTTQTIVKGLSA